MLSCNEFALRKSDYVVVDADQEMIETKEGAVKMLRCKHAQILTEEGLRFITGKSKAQQSLPEYHKFGRQNQTIGF